MQVLNTDGLISDAEARQFANNWIEAWNSRDASRILSEYSDDVVYQSPLIAQRGFSEDGVLIGKENVRAYVDKVLPNYPNLRFELSGVAAGVNSVIVFYRNVARNVRAAESFLFNRDRKVIEVRCHYFT
jgi:hypothetical protein